MTLFMSIARALAAIVIAPLLFGIINRTKAILAGRTGQPLLQPYFDIWKLLHKGAVYSRMTRWIFRLGPAVTFGAILTASLLTPWGGLRAPIAFGGDLIFMAYLLGLARFFTIAAALDTGSAFEGMGASREAFFSALTEPVLLIGLAALAWVTDSLSLSDIYLRLSPVHWVNAGPTLVLVTVALFGIALTENSRMPIDDPNTHLELTMIHEVMVLDHGGPDFAFIEYASALKLWIFGALLVGLAVPVRSENALIEAAAFLGGMFVYAMAIGIVESTMARLRLNRVPQMIMGAGALSVLAIFLELR
jgi:formate hydrogenlyase subunit 4